MTPKEKAIELNTKFMLTVDGANGFKISFRKHAINTVDEIINEYNTNICYCGYDNDFEMWNDKKQFWIDVKQELELL
ncbi:MAG: hypothetical protein QG594_1065 [Bacteroidota bacterium]|nr:hypothetical protein [Bacteroidota bacterium]